MSVEVIPFYVSGKRCVLRHHDRDLISVHDDLLPFASVVVQNCPECSEGRVIELPESLDPEAVVNFVRSVVYRRPPIPVLRTETFLETLRVMAFFGSPHEAYDVMDDWLTADKVKELEDFDRVLDVAGDIRRYLPRTWDRVKDLRRNTPAVPRSIAAVKILQSELYDFSPHIVTVRGLMAKLRALRASGRPIGKCPRLKERVHAALREDVRSLLDQATHGKLEQLVQVYRRAAQEQNEGYTLCTTGAIFGPWHYSHGFPILAGSLLRVNPELLEEAVFGGRWRRLSMSKHKAFRFRAELQDLLFFLPPTIETTVEENNENDCIAVE